MTNMSDPLFESCWCSRSYQPIWSRKSSTISSKKHPSHWNDYSLISTDIAWQRLDGLYGMFQALVLGPTTWLKVRSFKPFLFLFFSIGWNHRFNRLVDKYHPNIWHLVECLNREAVCVRQQMLKMTMGQRKKRSSKTIGTQEKIDTLESRLAEKKINVDDFLVGISLIIAMNWIIFLFVWFFIFVIKQSFFSMKQSSVQFYKAVFRQDDVMTCTSFIIMISFHL